MRTNRPILVIESALYISYLYFIRFPLSPPNQLYFSIFVHTYIYSFTRKYSLMKILQDWVSIRLNDPAFAIQRFQAFRNSSPSRPWISNSLTPPKKERRSRRGGCPGAAKETASLAVFDTKTNSELNGIKLGKARKTFQFRIPRPARDPSYLDGAQGSLFRHKVDNNLSSSRFGTYGLKGGKIASMRGEFPGIEVRLRVRKRGKWRGECEWESLARLWRCASIRISNTSISTTEEYSYFFVKVLNKLLPWILNKSNYNSYCSTNFSNFPFWLTESIYIRIK